MSFTELDYEVLNTLTHDVRALTLNQIARTWWNNSFSGRAAARYRLARLVERKLVQIMTVVTHPELPISEPVCVWAPGDSEPEFGKIAYLLQRRWTKAVERLPVYVATQRAARLMGGFGGRLKQPLQATHDLHVAAVFLLRRKQHGKGAFGWLLEDVIAHERRGEKLPDAVIRDGKSELVIEFGGAYRKERVRKVHEDCAERGLPYEIW